jgi:hypothetical protein
MAWVRIHEGAMQDLKISSLPDSAFRLWVRGLCYCQTALTDGLIPHSALRDMGAKRKDVDTLAAVRVEGRGPLWDRVDLFGFKVHDYLDWNESREVVLAKRQSGRDRAKQWRTNSVRNGERSTLERRDLASDVLLRDHDHSDQEKERASDFEAFWSAYPKKVGRAAAEREWNRLKPDARLCEAIAAALDVQRRSAQWTKDGGEFIPHARTWLHQRRWQDEVSAPRLVGGVRDRSWSEECADLHHGECGSATIHHNRTVIEAARAEREKSA